MNNVHRIVWLTGNTGAGKTTLATAMKARFPERVIVLDGDEMRATISTEEGLSPEDRAKHNRRVARLAHLLAGQGFLVIVAVIAPFTAVRREIDALCNPLWVYVKRDGLEGADRPYEPPEAPDLMIDTAMCSIDEGQQILANFLEKEIVDRTIAS